MAEKLASIEANHIEDDDTANANNSNNHGWQKVTYAKRQRKVPAKQPDSGMVVANGSAAVGVDKVFRSLEKHSEERRRRLEAQRAVIAAQSDDPVRSKLRSDDEDDDSDAEAVNGVVESGGDEKKVKPKKVKKPKVTVAEAAAKIDAADLADFLVEVTASYESQQDIQLMRFADYFGRAFFAVSASQFPWTKLFRESTVAKIVDLPLTHISEAVYKTSVEWINQRSHEALQSFALWSLDSILPVLASQHASVKGSKKSVQPTSSKSQVAIFAVLAMVLRRKPDVLIGILPTLSENSKYQGPDKLPVIVWMVAQACQGDLSVGLYSWAHNLLPLVGGKSSCNPQSRDLILQLVERILSSPKARTILVNGAVRKGERLLPPMAFDMLMRVTFPASSARVKATERFEAIYPTLKEVAFAGSAGSKAMKQVSQQILTLAVRAAGEGNPELSKEATSIFVWCLTQNADCFKQWDKIYMDNVEASVAILRKLNEEWKAFSVKQPSLDAPRETLKSFRQKNEKALAGGEDAARQVLFKDADKYCKSILGRVTRGHGCMKSVAFAIIALAVGAAVMSPDMESWDWNKLSVLFSQHSFQV
ncbi:Transmembrane protein [Actinidia chinensis var. chinensis]|uniref:Transmembrane protein n=1 Tax=Actinidia chinensis var. chinensis TaxID=1590841 RepID=A0A2R6PGR7_ACTCC|nr:Transmembrane protein [Actinidia chinensis var. chinensis]